MVEVIEEVSVYTPLGIRLWDPVTDKQICNSMLVTAHPANSPYSRSYAYKTRSDVFAFNHLPGMRAIENGYADESATGSPPDKHAFIIEIQDKLNRYVNVALRIELPLPYRGVFPSDELVSSPDTPPRGVYLYSSPSRSVPNWMATIRGELKMESGNQPAAYAFLRVSNLSGDEWYGITDEEGKYTIMLPYPDLPAGFSGSPDSPGHKPLFEQTWELDLEVLFSPNTFENLPGTSIPSYLSILRQDAASVWTAPKDEGGIAVTSLPILLEYNKTTNPRTEGETSLLIEPAVSSP